MVYGANYKRGVRSVIHLWTVCPAAFRKVSKYDMFLGVFWQKPLEFPQYPYNSPLMLQNMFCSSHLTYMYANMRHSCSSLEFGQKLNGVA